MEVKVGNNKTTLIDCPGFQDSKSVAQDIANCNTIYMAIKNIPNVKFLLTIEDGCFFTAKADTVVSVFEQLCQMFDFE